MHNDQSSPFGGDTTQESKSSEFKSSESKTDQFKTEQFTADQLKAEASKARAEQLWADFQRDLDVLGRQLAELGSHGAALGEHFLASLQARFEETKAHASTYKQAAEEQVDAARRGAESAYGQARASSTEAAKDAARQMWERAQPLRAGAKDVGEGLARAWTELRASFGKAAQRLHTEGDPRAVNGTTPHAGSAQSGTTQPGATPVPEDRRDTY